MTDERLREYQERLRELIARKRKVKQLLLEVDEQLNQTIAEFERELEQVSSK